MRKPLCFLLILFLLLCCSPAVTLGWNVADQYEKAMELLKENKYDEAGQAFIALGSYNDSPRYAMYCNAIVAGKKGVYSVAVENLNSLNDFLDSSLLAIYYAGLSWEASEDYEQASEVMSSITLYRDVAERIAGYPALINARDYRKADRDEKAGKLELALSGFLALGRYSDSAERAASVQEKIHARDYYIADEAELNGDFAKAYSGFAALGDYKDSAQRAAVVKNKGNYAQAMQYAMEGDFSRAYSLFTDLADYEDSADKAYVLGVSQFAPLSDRKKGIAVFEFHDKWGLINVNTNSTTSPFWDEIGDFNKFGLAPVVKNKKYGYINTDGDIVIPCKWHMVSEFNEDGICTVSRESERNYYYGLYDNTGKEITSPEWRTLGGSYTLALGYGSDRDWITIPEFNEGKIKVQNDAGLYGFIDLEGKLVGKVCWNEIKAFSEGLAVVVEDGKYGFIDKNGDVVIRPQYTDALSFSENLAGVKNGSLWGFINRDNEFVIEPVYNEVKPFSGGWADVFHSESGWQIIDNAGKLIYFADRKLIEDYKSAMDRFDAADYEEAIGIFVTLKGYRDSFEKIEECRQKINQKDYQAAFALQQAGKYEEAIEAFRKLEEFSDAKRQIELCQACINDREYQKAVALKEEGKYEEAIEAFKKLGEYSDAKRQIELCQICINDREYHKAVALKEEGKYEEAIEAFKKLGEHSDAKRQIELCQTCISDREYQKAVALQEEGKYEEALKAFKVLEGYKDSSERVDSIYQNNRTEILRHAGVGDFIVFGSYEQDNNTANGMERIEWIVLAKEKNKALIISKYALDCQKYNTSRRKVTWETCSLRKWLNGTFLDTAFSPEEQRSIIRSNVRADKNPARKTSAGNNTTDKIFLLSISEVNKYFSSFSSRNCQGTEYSYSQGVYKSSTNGNSWWWLRTPGDSSDQAAYVNTGGAVSFGGMSVANDYSGVRPALWVDLGH